MIFTSEYMSGVSRCWKKYIRQRHPIPDSDHEVRSEVLASWKRSLEFGVPPHMEQDPCLDDQGLKTALQKNVLLLQVAEPYLSNLYGFIKGSNYVLHLVDKNGIVLQLFADDDLIRNLINFSRENMRVGSIRTERATGTNSTSLALALGRPVQLLGEEHFLERSQAFFCCSAPFFSKEQQLLGALTIFGPRDMYQSHTMGMVIAAADSIQRSLVLQKSVNELALANQILSATIGSLSSAIVILDNHQIIVQNNDNLYTLLKIPPENLVGRHLGELVNLTSLPEDVRDLNHTVDNYGITLTTIGSSRKVDISLTVKVVRSDAGTDGMVVLVMDRQEVVHQLATRIGGFTAKYTFDSIIGPSAIMESVKAMGSHAARIDSNVLILGESGTGKELLAHSIHNAGDRVDGPFVAVNCGSIPKELIESELFGYEGGAFTGARKEGCPGKFELANGGTLFLDEIGDMPYELQATLLRVLQSRQIMRIGGKHMKEIDVRLVAATNSNLLEATHLKKFRSDLYYRLNVFAIHLPPLRDRPEDILPLALHLMRVYSASLGKPILDFDGSVKEILRQHTWPGNIRELENVIERAVVIAAGDSISEEDLPGELQASHKSATPYAEAEEAEMPVPTGKNTPDADLVHDDDAPELPLSSAVFERKAIIKALNIERGHVPSAAARLEVPVRKLYRRIKKYKIDLEMYRDW